MLSYMSNKRRRIQGSLPINTLSSSLHARENDQGSDSGSNQNVDPTTCGQPKRYREFRKDLRVVEEVNRLSTKSFLPLDTDDEKLSSESQEEHADEELAGNTLLRRSARTGNGLLFSSPMENERRISITAATTTKLNLSGSFRTLDMRKQWDEKAKCLLTFIADSEGPRVSFTHRNFEIKNAQVEFLKDCEIAFFDKGFSCIGLVLREPRFIDMDNKSKIGRAHTRLFMWMSSADGKDGKIGKIKDIIVESETCKVKLVGSKALVINKLQQAAIKHYKGKNCINSANETFGKSKPNYWEKKEFQSLEPQRRLSQFTSSASHKIHIPKTPEVHDLDKNMLPQISTASFFNKSSPPHNENTSSSTSAEPKNDALQELKMSRRTRSQSPALRQSTLWNLDSERDFETPEIFKPKLRYTFADGTSYTVTNQDFKSLYNHDWINDSILDFFTKYYAERAIERGIVSRDDVYIMSSFFYTKLVSDPNDYYGNVRKWVNNCDLFKKKFVVVPINSTFHWFGCIITNLDVLYNHFMVLNKGSHSDSRSLQAINDKSLNITTSNDDDEVSVSTPIVKILTFDSLRQTHGREIDPIKEFLISYAKDKYSLDVEKGLIKMKTCVVPQQPNMSDCGVHVILNTKKFFEDPGATMEVWRTTKARSKASTRVVNEYFDKAAREKARKDLRNVLWDLQKIQIKLMRERNEDVTEDDGGIKNEDEDDGDLEIIENYPPDKKFEDTLEGSSDIKSTTHKEKIDLHLPERKALQTLLLDNEFPTYEDQKSPQFDKPKIVYHSGRAATQRHLLENSPVLNIQSNESKKNSEGTSSPYFGESPLKKRAPSFDYEKRDIIFPPPNSSFVDNQRSEADIGGTTRSNSLDSSGSPIMLTNEISHSRDFPIRSDHYEGKKSPQSSSLNDTVVVSDLEQDEDVNLVGEIPGNKDKNDHLNHIRNEVELELSENASQINGNRSPLNRPNERKGHTILIGDIERRMNNDNSSPEHPEDERTSQIIVSHEDIQAIPSDEEK